MRDHCDCIRDNHAQIRKIHQAILEKAGQRRKELLAAHKEGKISAEQLREGLAGLHKRVHEEMRNNPQKRQNLKDLRICREELHRNIASVLNERQLRLWREWLQGKK